MTMSPPPDRSAKPPLIAPLALALLGLLAVAGSARAQIEGYGIAREIAKAVEKKEYGRARRMLDEVREPLQKKALAWQVYQFKESGARFHEIVGLLRTIERWPNFGRIAERAEDAIAASDNPREIVSWFAASPPRTGSGWMAYVAALSKRGDEAGAEKAVVQAWRSVLLSAEDERAILKQYHGSVKPEDDRVRLAFLLRARREADVQRLLARSALPSDEREAAAIRLLMQARNAAAPDEIEARLAKLPADLRQSADLLFDEIMWHRRAERFEAAGRILAAAPPDLLHSARWWTEGSRVVRELLAAGKPEDAYRVAAGHTQSAGEGLATMEFLAGWIALRRLEKPAAALAHFRRIHGWTSAALSRSRAAYWAGRAAAATGDAAGAERWFVHGAAHPHTFYGQLSIVALGRSSIALPADIAASEVARKRFAETELPRAAAFFLAIGSVDAARVVLMHLAMEAETAADYALIADFAASGGIERREIAVRAARRGARFDVPLFAFGFPKLELPSESRVEPAFILALARQESEFYLGAVSATGARGLMQIMPATAQQVARQLKLPYELDRLTTDAAYNLRLGSHFLERMVERYDGSYAIAAAAYNAGPGRVGQWLAKYGDPRKDNVDLIDWIETIPFEETRNYVQRVLENLAIYRQRSGLRALGAPPASLWRPVPAEALKVAEVPPPLP
jgi:soluble lytic murein transglycosylase